MNGIPTAINFLESRGYFDSEDYEDLLIEFAKLHVEAALLEASKKAWTKNEWGGNTGSEYCDTVVDKESIINSYPLSNIK